MTVLTPVSLLVGALSMSMRNSGTRVTELRDPLVDSILVYSSLFVAYLVFSPRTQPVERMLLQPGNDVRTALRAEYGDALPWVQLVGNVLLLLPLGALVPLRVRRLDTLGKVAVAGLLVSCAIELTQFLVLSGRVASTDDVVLNTIGATLGGLLARSARRQAVPAILASSEAPAAVRSHRRAAADERYPVWWLIARVEQERSHGRRPPRRPSNEPAQRA